ncbi:MAG: phosphoribosylformylglycinamidine synthase [Endozoicomonadaceae bacterium]|nr:phosphoribosylformylglycinamidine synthase [Endozoicomonadaceae bacterium]
MRVLFRQHAASDERSQLILKKLQRVSPLISSVLSVQYYWLLMSDSKPLLSQQEAILSQLLQADWLIQDAENSMKNPCQVIVLPRIGTISPWSSKATNIIHNVGLTTIDRVEWGIGYSIESLEPLSDEIKARFFEHLYDPMTESLCHGLEDITQDLFMNQMPPKPFNIIDIMTVGFQAIDQANQTLGLALSNDEMHYLFDFYKKLQKNPSDVELMMFAQVNSEHCRHKFFNAKWRIDGQLAPLSLFDMIRETYRLNSKGVLSAYKDNAAVMEGFEGHRFLLDAKTYHYYEQKEMIHILMKVETHNHPTAISPYEGAATGSGGEIRDEGATGLGSKPKSSLTGFSVSNLHIPNWSQPWEISPEKPSHIASALDIMLEGPLGSASFNNEFGRPNLCGYFRTYESEEKTALHAMVRRGYHKPIMIAGGLGHIRSAHVEKKIFQPGAILIVLGGPAMRIGLGGGAASSIATGVGDLALDFASVQRSNPEIERRCQEVIDRCCQLQHDNPIAFIHDVGAGGLSNALPELILDGECGGVIDLRAILCDESNMSPLEIWCNESQERYVLAVNPDQLSTFKAICKRERCPYAQVGYATDSGQLTVEDKYFKNQPVNLPLSMLLSDVPKQIHDITLKKLTFIPLDTQNMVLSDALTRVLRLPAVAAKHFLISIGDRSITGQVVREQMVGPWQVPVGDHAVTCHSYSGYHGEAMAMGERSPVALLSPEASGRLAVGEAITNLAASLIGSLSNIKLSANWMVAMDYDQEDAALYRTVKAVALELCPALGLTIPVGKDSLSMQTVWESNDTKKTVVSPLSLVISAFAPVIDVRHSITPQLRVDQGETLLLCIDLGGKRNGLGGSALAQVYNQVSGIPPDVHQPARLKDFFDVIQHLLSKDYLLAYHDRSDGGLIVTLLEMAFAGQTGILIELNALMSDQAALFSVLFSEELGAVIQIKKRDWSAVKKIFECASLLDIVHPVGRVVLDDTITILWQDQILLSHDRIYFQRIWQETTYHMQTLRDNPCCAQAEFDNLLVPHTGLTISCKPTHKSRTILNIKPKLGILREQGVNGHIEMAAAFYQAGFDVYDIHMSDLVEGRHTLSDYKGMIFCGGFSYGDVLGAGVGWASTILYHTRVSDLFSDFFNRPDTFSLGVCNGCQTLSHLKHLIPGAGHWPSFIKNKSQQFEARTVMVEIEKNPSILLTHMENWRLPIPVAHGEGLITYSKESMRILNQNNQIIMRYVDDTGCATQRYPYNPNGSIEGVAGLTSLDGRVTIMMPHPERVFRSIQQTWMPNFREVPEESAPWMQLFHNARHWLA